MRFPVPSRLAWLALAALLGAGAHAQSQRPFTFTKADLQLLRQCEELDRQFEKRALVYHNADLEKHLNEVAAPLLPGTPLDRVQWKFRILRDPMVNAFALPNGSIYVNTGLLARAENDDQLVAVLAHEVVHVTNRHTYLFHRSLRRKVLVSEIIALAADWIPAGSWGAVVVVAANIGDFAIVDLAYGYSRQLEEEADRAGMERLKLAGRDPAQMVRIFEIVDDKLEPEPIPRFFWDHPKPKDRIAYLSKIAGARKSVPVSDPDYTSRNREVILQNMQLDLDSRRFRSSVAAGERLAQVFPRDATVLRSLGESYRELGPREARRSEREQTDASLRKAYQQTIRRTEADDTKALAVTPEGRAALESNHSKAEALFRRAIDEDPSLADSYFGLAALYEDEGKTGPALDAYRKCAELAKLPGEQERARRRIEALAANRAGASQ
jgi:predicted Zn-dependent protease